MEIERERERERGGREAVLGLIEKATNSTDRQVDPRLLKAIKFTVRSSDDEVRVAVQVLMDKMKKEHSQVRYLALLIIDELFMRSKLFRSLFVDNFDQFLSLSIGFRRNLPLPPPSAIASILRSKSIELLEKWNSSFGLYYRQIRLGFNYLKNTLRFQFPNNIENAARLQQERREREIRTKEILVTKYENLKENFTPIKAEIQSTLDQLGECLDIVRINDGFVNTNFHDDDESEEFTCPALLQIRTDSIKEGEKVYETGDNKAIFDALRELYKLLISKHMVSVQEWISVLVRVDLSDNRFRDSALKEFIDFRNQIQSVKKRCEECGCILHHATEPEEEDLWEEGRIEIHEPGNSYAPNSSNGVSVDTPSIEKQKSVVPSDREIPVSQDTSGSMSPRLRLLAEAPLMTWDSFLDNWGSRDVLANQRGLELESHWGRVDDDAVIPAGKIAELNVHKSVYKEKPVEIPPCLAPLKKGGFCQRRDLKVCPFHGLIIPRDTDGNPIENNASTSGAAETSSKQASKSLDEGTPLGSKNELVEQLVKQAVKNIRGKDRDAKSSKRAKLAKVREHNEAVLRKAALASTSQSEAFGEDESMQYENRSGIRVKRPTLASMLKKKVTTKDRLAQRLLNTQVTDSAIRQLTQGEDAKYREAYPNQW